MKKIMLPIIIPILLLAGCAWLPSEPEDVPPMLDPSEKEILIGVVALALVREPQVSERVREMAAYLDGQKTPGDVSGIEQMLSGWVRGQQGLTPEERIALESAAMVVLRYAMRAVPSEGSAVPIWLVPELADILRQGAARAADFQRP